MAPPKSKSPGHRLPKVEAAEQKKKMKTLERFKEDNPEVFATSKKSVRDSQQKANKARQDAEAAMAESQRLLREHLATESELMNFQFGGTADEKDDQSKEIALLRAAVRLATATAALVRAQNNDRQPQLQFTVAYESDLKMWKKRRARDVRNEIVATKKKLEAKVLTFFHQVVELSLLGFRLRFVGVVLDGKVLVVFHQVVEDDGHDDYDDDYDDIYVGS
ncbi:hypothetical protein KC332_g1679 [Hortaea werneckii]|nr:hypothetical protein KC358_g1571 [Hortaea werneckii]KAI6849585.1 hypothetical protein KC350_g2534 [Hortaea werneckii]KAI6943045.1 hypothetical protein KC341_g1764 [Hortaea werneckii]KAI6943142.1 hypothetical protein KC348_g4340 [Hortaea werneckii]KAI6980877.1 hypothetical protein KC321_g1539 [Hortaea werneckii]